MKEKILVPYAPILVESTRSIGYSKDAAQRVLRFDIQRTDELFAGWQDEEYGSSSGLDNLTTEGVDLIIGGPPLSSVFHRWANP